MDFSIVFPVMNQADHIEKVIGDYHIALSMAKLSFELVAVVNCTKDNSFEICRKTVKQFNNVCAYELKGCGYGLGILYGLKKSKGKYLCYLNCARIKPDELVKSLRFFLKHDNSIVHGTRQQRENQTRSVASKIYNSFVRFIFSIPQRDINGNPNIFSRKNYELLKLSSTDSMIDLELLDKAKRLGIPVVEYPIEDYLRVGGKSTSNMSTIFRLMKEVGKYLVRTRLMKNE